MTKITVDKALIEQVLKALTYCEALNKSVELQKTQAINALRAALVEPAEVPLLTSGEMEAAWLGARGTLKGYGPFARAIEQAVRQKAGL